MLGEINDELRKAGAYDIVLWRRIQALADIRALCAHAGAREPTADEVQSLIGGVRAVTASL